MEHLLDASAHERQLRKRVRLAASIEEALGEIFEDGGVEPDPPAAPEDLDLSAEVETDAGQPGGTQHFEERAALHDDIADLLDLVDCGMSVIWPPGWDHQRARLMQRSLRSRC